MTNLGKIAQAAIALIQSLQQQLVSVAAPPVEGDADDLAAENQLAALVGAPPLGSTDTAQPGGSSTTTSPAPTTAS